MVKCETCKKEYPDWYSAYHIEMKITNVLGSIPENFEALKYVVRHYQQKFKLTKREAEAVANLPKEYIEHQWGEEQEQPEQPSVRSVFRRTKDGKPYFSYGQIIGWLEEAMKSLGLTKVIKNIPLTFVTEPRKIVPKEYKMVGDIVVPVQKYSGGPTALCVHECMEYCVLVFDLLTTNKTFDKYADQIFEVGRRMIGFGPRRAHGFGEIEELKWKKLD